MFLWYFPGSMGPMEYSVVLAGGKGVRLWPLSRSHTPKPFISLRGDTLLNHTLQRLGQDHVFCIVPYNLVEQTKAAVPTPGVIVEPHAAGTAAAIGLATRLIYNDNPKATVACLPADHWIENPRAFSKALQTAHTQAQQTGKLVTLGATPLFPRTDFGYLELAEKRTEPLTSQPPVHKVKRFIEKPSLEVAQSLCNSGTVLWNMGIFVGTATSFQEAIAKHLPDLHRTLQQIQSSDDVALPQIQQSYTDLSPISFDHGVMDHIQDALCVPVDCGWSDVGSHGALANILASHKRNTEDPNSSNVFLSSDQVAAVDSHHCIAITGKNLLALAGVENITVIETKDAILIADNTKPASMRALAKLLEEKFPDYT